MDIAAILILTILMIRATEKTNIVDDIGGCLIATVILYGLIKIPFFYGLGLDFHFSSLFSFLIVGSVYCYAFKKKYGNWLSGGMK